MAWSIESGTHEGVDLSGLNVVLVPSALPTRLASVGPSSSGPIRSAR